MSAHYQRLLRMIQNGRYFHVGSGPYFKSYGYVENVVHQYCNLMTAPRDQVHGKVFYLADYEPIDLVRWCNALGEQLGAPRIRSVPRSLARVLALGGDAVNAVGVTSFPFNSFRLRNVVTEYIFDMRSTEAVCGKLPRSFDEAVAATASWFKRKEASRLASEGSKS
jgi:nucleoside-diphosphate-sugar epimerase